jgi:small GTP-binding protein
MQLNFEIAVVGEARVGKTQFTRTLCNKTYNKKYTPSTTYTDYQTKIQVPIHRNNILVQLKIRDIAGAQNQRQISLSFINTAAAVILMYDMTNQQSFFSVPSWIADIRQQNLNIPIFLVANKNDLVSERAVSTEAGKKLVSEYELLDFLEISVKTGNNKSASLLPIGSALLKKQLQLDAYHRIYQALCAGSNKPFIKKANHDLASLEELQAKAEAKPHSRTHTALRLAQNYQFFADCNAGNSLLVAAIHQACFSGETFHKTHIYTLNGRKQTFFTEESYKHALQNLSPADVKHDIEQHRQAGGRKARICMALGENHQIPQV